MSDDLDAPRCPASISGICLDLSGGFGPCPEGECNHMPGSGRLAAYLLARVAHHALDRNPHHAARCVACGGLWPCETEQWAAAVRSLQADYGTALDVIAMRQDHCVARYDDGMWWLKIGMDFEMWPKVRKVTDAEWAVLAAAGTRRTQDTGP